MLLRTLREEVLAANLELVREGVVIFTFGNVSGISRKDGLVAIKPSGVPYEELTPEQIVVTDLDGRIVDTNLRPSSDLPTHLELYAASPTSAASPTPIRNTARPGRRPSEPIPCLGTTHADYFHGPIPVTPDLTPSEIGGDYEKATGEAIVRTFKRIDPNAIPGVLVAGHAPFCWGKNAADAVHNAVSLEYIARMATWTLSINPDARALARELHDKHSFRKHGAGAYYGQGEGRIRKRCRLPYRHHSPPARRAALRRSPAHLEHRASGGGVAAHGHRGRRRFRHAQRSRFDRRQRAGNARLGGVRVSACTARAKIRTIATQSHDDHMRALADATREAVKAAGIRATEVDAIALDTTGSSVVAGRSKACCRSTTTISWCDHRAKNEAAEITELAHREGLKAIEVVRRRLFGGVGLRQAAALAPAQSRQARQVRHAFEHCDMVAATLAGITDPNKVKRSICAMGHKWLWNPDWADCRRRVFSSRSILSSRACAPSSRGNTQHRTRSRVTSATMGRKARPQGGHPDPRRRLRRPLGRDRRRREGRRCGQRRRHVDLHHRLRQTGTLIPGVCGVVRGSVHPQYTGIEAGLSGVGDIFNAIATRAQSTGGRTVKGPRRISRRTDRPPALPLGQRRPHRAGQCQVGGIAIGWNLTHTAQDELFAAIEGTAFHTRVILDRMSEYGALTQRVINGGGIPQNNPVLNQVYANVLGRPVLVPASTVTGLGSAIFAFLAAGAFRTIEEAQAHVCPAHAVFTPQADAKATYDTLYGLFSRIYFDFGTTAKDSRFGDVLPTLIKVARG